MLISDYVTFNIINCLYFIDLIHFTVYLGKKSLEKKVRLFGDLKTPKFPSEIN
jgi:hypothetical protein